MNMNAKDLEADQEFGALNTDKVKLNLSGLTQQTGVALVSPEKRPIIDHFDDTDKDRKLFRTFPPKDAPIVLQVTCQLQSLTGLSELVRELRKRILDIQEFDDGFIEQSFNCNNLVLTRTVAPLKAEEIESLLESKRSIIDKYIKSQVRIGLLLTAIENLEDQDRDKYKLIFFQLKKWQKIIEEILPNLAKNQYLNQLIEIESQKQRGKNDQEIYRLKRLLSGEKAGSDQEASDKLKNRVIQALLGQTDKIQQTRVQNDLIEELLATATTINDIRLIDRLKKEGINLLDLREKVKEIKKRYQQYPEQATQLNQEIINQIAIPIANKIHRLFPHASNDSPTLIAAALYRDEAVCAGKAEIITSIFKLLGLKASSEFVSLTLDDVQDEHAIAKIYLFANQQLFIDANYHLQADDYPAKYREKIIANAASMNIGSEVLLYLATKIDLQEFRSLVDHKFKAQEASGQIVYFQTNIPYPHQIVCQEQEGNFSSSAHNNYAVLLSKLKRNEEAEKHYLEALSINPDNATFHYNYANLLSKLNRNEEAEKHYLEALRINPDNAKFHNNYASLLSNLNRNEEAEKYYLEGLKINPNDAWIRTAYADFLQEIMRIDEAIIAYRKALKLMIENPNEPNWLSKEKIEERITDLRRDRRNNKIRAILSKIRL